MIEILPLQTLDGLSNVITGYTSAQKYTIARTETSDQINFSMQLVRLETPYVKHFDEYQDEETLQRYTNFLQQDLSLGAYEDDQLVGVAIAEAQAWNNSLWVWEFHVAETHRGRGIGEWLMKRLFAKGQAANLRAVFCETQTTNVPAINFYRKMGFTCDGINLSFYTNEDWPDGEVAMFMKKTLTANL
jgi:ribosomal protein S18 acetylase RimI-like enzyme